MNYQKIYDAFIADRRIKESSLEGYTEKHHIVPRSLGGSDSADNLVSLTPEDHIRAHVLLGRIHGNQMWFAVTAMMGNRKRYGRAPTRRERLAVAMIRRQQILGNRKGVLHSEEAKARISKTASQQRWWNDGSVQTRSIECPEGYSSGGLPRATPKWSESGVMRIQEAARQPRPFQTGDRNVSHRPEVKAKISAAVSGDNHYSRTPGYMSKLFAEDNPARRPEVKEKSASSHRAIQSIKRQYFERSGFVGNKRSVTLAQAQSWLAQHKEAS